MLEKLSEYFYDPVVFWTAPLVLVALGVGCRRLWARGLKHLSEAPPGNGSGDAREPGDDC